MRKALLLTALFLFVLNVFAQSDGSQQNLLGKSGTFAITGATIVTVSGGIIENGVVIIENGKIAAVGQNVSIPSKAEVINARGLFVYPGMIDAATTLGLVEIPLGANGTVDVSEVGDNNANAKAIVGINPHSSHVNVARINGVTTVLSMPTGGLISGQAAVINLWGSTQAQMAVVPTFALVVNFPRVAAFGSDFGQQQMDFNEAIRRRDQQLENLKRIFKDAGNYARAKEAYIKDKTLPAPKTDVKLEALIPYVRAERPVIFTAERERDIRAAVKFIEEFKLKGIILGGQEAWRAADVLKNVPVIYTNIFRLPVREDDPYDYLFEAPSKMLQAGIRFAIATSDGGANVRDLPYQAGMAVAFGLPKEEALKAVTLYPAQILGIADRLGSIEVGKIANIVVTDGDILDPRTNIKYLFINGRLMPLTSRHTELYERFKDRR
ncbi:MAG: amidohydrolase family protein [Pyrinomonadaceae bacterium]|nr:amidohydrolase family protein [Pyrinomonadaceae bacterium]MCX7640174.1 amidohydrolase family protein [Pyrinomonadaceae bacterium]MDW8303238.1 amidohydrolase family protein [Acidobacteriota bacterium]